MVYAGASLVSVALLWAALRFQRVSSAQSTILALGGATANSIFLGFPVALAVLPERATEVFAWVIFAEAAIIMPVVSTLALLAERSEGERALVSSLKALFRRPVVLGLLAGFAFSASGLRLPGWADTVVNSIVAAAPFLALFVIGGNVLQFRLSRSGPRVMTVAIGKLVSTSACRRAVVLDDLRTRRASGLRCRPFRSNASFPAIPHIPSAPLRG